MDENVTYVDQRTIGANRYPHDDPRTPIPPYLRAHGIDDPPEPPAEEVRETDDDDPGNFASVLLMVAIAFAVVGAARLVWNLWEEAQLDYGMFFVLDRSMTYFAAFGLFVIAAGVWRRR